MFHENLLLIVFCLHLFAFVFARLAFAFLRLRLLVIVVFCLLRWSGRKTGGKTRRGFQKNNNILQRKLPGCQLFKCWYLPTNTADVGQLGEEIKKAEWVVEAGGRTSAA